MVKVDKIEPVLGVGRMPDVNLLKLMNTVHDGMNANPVYPNPPVDPAAFKKEIETFTALVSDAEDGGKKAISAKNKQRVVVTKMFTQLGHYVEAASDGDLAKFNTSGFVAISRTRSAPEPLSPAEFDWIDRGPISGQIVVKVKSQKKAVTYEVRFAPQAAGTTPAPWTILTLTSPKKETVHNLTPATTYLFQVRALGKLGYTDWSESKTFICA
jgi:hypothetical protein